MTVSKIEDNQQKVDIPNNEDALKISDDLKDKDDSKKKC